MSILIKVEPGDAIFQHEGRMYALLVTKDGHDAAAIVRRSDGYYREATPASLPKSIIGGIVHQREYIDAIFLNKFWQD